MKSKPNPQRTPLPIATKEGEFLAEYSAKGLAGLSFPKAGSAPSSGAKTSPTTAELRRWHSLTTQAVKAVLAGRAPGELPPLDLSSGTPFQQKVWSALRKIAPGKTRSYAEIAAAIGKPKAARAVGGACGANVIPVLIPCHRVLASGGGLGGFTAGLEWKHRLLDREKS